jgi:hypothetical protein
MDSLMGGALKPRQDESERFRSPLLSIGGVALLSGLEPDTIWLLTKKGVLNPMRNSGKMIFKRGDVDRWLQERRIR